MITVAEADRLLAQHVLLLGDEPVALEKAVGRVLRDEVVADRDYPPFDRVTMDGVAVASSGFERGVRRFRIEARQHAGEPPRRLGSDDACIEVMTGAVLPAGADSVVRYEDVAIGDGVAEVGETVVARSGQFVHAAGSDCRSGDVVVPAGARLTPPRIAALASVGRTSVPVARQPSVEIVSTGDELVAPGEPVLPHQIRQSNGPAIRAVLASAGFGEAAHRHVADDEVVMHAAIEGALARSDVLVLTGGVSMGRSDFVPAVLRELGVEEVFHRVLQRPGKPLWFGRTDDGRPVFGLPGNPVSSLVCTCRYVLPYLARASGMEATAPLELVLREAPGAAGDLTRFVPVRRSGRDAVLVRYGGSGDVVALAPSDGFVEVEPGFSPPAPVTFFAW